MHKLQHNCSTFIMDIWSPFCQACVASLKNTAATVSIVSSRARHEHKRGLIVNDFQFARNIVLTVIITMFVMFPFSTLASCIFL